MLVSPGPKFASVGLHYDILKFGKVRQNLRLKTIVFARAGATKWDSARIFLKKYITGPKYMYWKCRYRGGDHMAHQSKTPLKLHQSGSDFHRKLSSYLTLILYWLDLLRRPIKNFNFPGFGARLSPPPQIRKYQVYPNTTNLKLFFNFAYVLTIIADILGPLGVLHLWKEIISPIYCCKNGQKYM